MMIEQSNKIPLLVVVGPTASGKTGLAIELARSLNGEVVSADSMQIYKRMEIGTAKPTADEMGDISHHLIDFVEPDDAAFSVADYARLARTAIAEISARSKLPILSGGTGLYVNAVIDNIDYTDIASDEKVRQQLNALAQEKGNEHMLALLAEADPALAATLHPNNLGRILRALEVYRLTGITMSEHQRRSRLVPAQYDLCMLGLNFSDRAHLYERINRRVDLMIKAGLLDEAQEISKSYGGTARQAIGYKELQPYLDGELPLEVCIDNLKQATRHYAKRQLTWFRRDERIHWILADTFENAKDLVLAAQNIVHNSGIL
ncbi:tRNA (adenosine(37)-N6)-dimethylallyltransferase MiaA [Oscillospiraceae bacterium PP1C4]